MRLETVLWMRAGGPLHVNGGVARPYGPWRARPAQLC